MADVERVDRRLSKLQNGNRSDERLQRSIVLDLLSGIKGVSIHEQGRIERKQPKKRTKFEEQYMNVDKEVGAQGIVRGTSPELVGVADMFGGV